MNRPTDPQRVLLFEDDGDVRTVIEQSLALEGFDVEAHAEVGGVIDRLTPQFDGVIVTDIRMPGMDGREAFRRVRQIDPEIPVLIVTGHAAVQEAVELMREGAYDFLTKPFAAARLVISVRNASEQRGLVLDNRRLRDPTAEAGVPLPLRGDSDRIRALRALVRELADADVPMLVVGETGTGKVSLARALHDSGPRRQRPFVVVDCAALPETLLDAELFGSAPAAGGLARRRAGRLEAAERGTLFLENIDRLPPPLQARLIAALEAAPDAHGEAGGRDWTRPATCRVIAASTGDLARAYADGSFRSDLYFRLNTLTLRLPPLRERREDLAPLLGDLLAAAGRRLKRAVPDLSRTAQTYLYSHHWPGNLRELSHFAERLILGISLEVGASSGAVPTDPLPIRIERFEAGLIRDALRSTRGDVKSCLEILRIPRKTFYDKVARHGIDLDSFRRNDL
jgi:two-component system C4-dicarboxylate transport response regulator DctD